MKKIVYVSGALFSSISLLSVLFKLHYLQGAQILLIIGIVGLTFIFIPLYTIYKYKQK